jgi:DNA modification methylase
MRLEDLAPNPDNPRKISDEKLKMLGSALLEFGDLGGIVFNRRTKRLAGGHQRVRVLPAKAEVKLAKTYKTPTRTGTVAEGYVELEGERYRYREVDWDETKEKAANIAANQHGGEFDLPKLSEWLVELDTAGFDLRLTGFDEQELADIISPVHQFAGQCDEDDVPEAPADPKTRRGDIYELGRHRLMCGDSTAITDVERLMGGDKADMVFTDPPYGMNLDTDYSKIKGSKNTQASAGTVAKKYTPIIGDDQDFDPGIIFGLFDYCKEVFLWGADYYCQSLPKDGSFHVWDKNNGNESADKMIGSGYELCWSKERHKKEMCRIFGRGTFGHDKVKVHPTQKPVQLVEWFFERWGKPEDLVADLFGGSGSTLIACEKTNRRCFMMELDPKYCDVIVARWEKYTGKHAKLLTGNSESAANV